MARGDASASLTVGVASGASKVLQPSSGVEILVHRVASSRTPGGTAPNDVSDVSVDFWDGTNEAIFVGPVVEDFAALLRAPLHFHIDNTTYMRVINQGSGAANLTIDGTVTK